MQYLVTVLYTIVVDGGWSPLKRGPCSKTCGIGGRYRYTRVCDNPKPSCGGKQCEGSSTFTISCYDINSCCPGNEC